jgi:GH24 family phage-related lysozyme (muramidase)
MNNFDIEFIDTEIIRRFEGKSLTAYWDKYGKVWTISYGLTGPDIVKGLVLTEEQSSKMFMDRIEKMVFDLKNLIKIDITKNQFIACLSFSWNVGIKAFGDSTLLKLLNAGAYDNAAEQFLRWNKAGGKILSGLTKRRKAERSLFLS